MNGEPTQGPYRWHGGPGDLRLVANHGDHEFVMGFVRRGRSGAAPSFPSGWGMLPAVDLAVYETTSRHRVRSIDHPNARLIEESWALYDLAQSSLEILEELLGRQCDPGCDCILHDLRAVIGRIRGDGEA